MNNADQPINPHLVHTHSGEVQEYYKGLTKREHFAAMAMQGLLSNPSQIDTTNFEWVAQHATGYADELLTQLEITTK